MPRFETMTTFRTTVGAMHQARLPDCSPSLLLRSTTSPFVAQYFIQSAHTSGNRWADSAYRITETLRTPQMTRRNNAIMRIACDRPRIPLGFNVIIIVKGHFLRTAVNIYILEVAILRNEPCSWRQDSQILVFSVIRLKRRFQIPAQYHDTDQLCPR